MTDNYDRVYFAASDEPWWLEAIAEIETGQNPQAKRYGRGEYVVWKRVIKGKASWAECEWRHDPQIICGRWGIMAMPLFRAISMGFAGEPVDLLDPHVCVKFAERFLRNRRDRYGSMSAAVAAYGSLYGTPRITGGRFQNAHYVNRVCNLADKIRDAQTAVAGRT